MFSRACVRAAGRNAPSFAHQASHHPHSPLFAKLPSRVGTPVQTRTQHRPASTAANARALFKEYPFSVSLASAINYVYNTYIIKAFHKFPEPVAKKLRRALYYTNISLSPKDALKYYKQALEVADEIGMDPFSDEIIGVKIQIAELMERIQNYSKSIEVLEILRRDCLAWEEKLGGKEGNAGKRTRVLAKTVAISIKLAELYASEYVRNKSMAEERLVWAVEAILKEKQRRDEHGVKEGEGDWVTDSEIGASLETLAHHYEEANKHYLATPLFLQALALRPKTDCHSVVLMNNLSICLAQQLPPQAPNETPPSHTSLVENARLWAQKAIDVAAAIQPPERNEECDMGCVVATHNLGEFAEMLGNYAEARNRYEEAKSVARAIGFDEGAMNSESGLRRIKGKN
ncbi:hypothetical protein LTR60_000539 [Cryomyces antarcticus]|nr:hypothetical protein LTR39_003763 [Cryomyces antarcticus]KAK5020414.1 hypothetical protein LTR60_000539 [Cryomyces antarcticus]